MNEFAKALAGLASVLNHELSPVAIEGYWAVLSGEFGENELVGACRVFAKESRWMPKPVDFVELIRRGEIGGADVRSDAMRAWASLQSVWTNSSAVREICLKDARTASGVAALGGWFTMVNSGEEPKWQRKAFVEAFCGEAQEARRLQVTAGHKQLEAGS